MMELTLQEEIQMETLAMSVLNGITEALDNAQAIVLLTQKGNYYSYCTTLDELTETEDRIVTELTEKDDTEVCSVLAVWEQGGVDLPSYGLRKKLIALNEANRDAWILLTHGRSIESTMPKK